MNIKVSDEYVSNLTDNASILVNDLQHEIQFYEKNCQYPIYVSNGVIYQAIRNLLSKCIIGLKRFEYLDSEGEFHDPLSHVIDSYLEGCINATTKDK